MEVKKFFTINWQNLLNQKQHKQMETNDLPLFNYTVVPSNETETSKDAAESIKDKVNGMCLEVLRCVRSHEEGLTCDQVEEILGMKHQTASARLNDLSKCQPAFLQHRFDSSTGKPLRRPTRSGRTARIYFVTPYGMSVA